MTAATIRASVLTGYVETARSVGLDPLRMMDAAGIPRDALNDPDRLISSVAMRDMLEASGRAAEDFALRMSERRTQSVLGPVALVAREQPTIRAVIEAINNHMGLHTSSATTRLQEVGDLTFNTIVHDWPPGPTRQSIELALSLFVRTMRTYLGSDWRPARVCMTHAAPSVLDTHRRIFGPNLEFSQAFNGVGCLREDLEQPNPLADPEMARQIERFVGGLRSARRDGVADKVRDAVVGLLSTGRCTAETVSRELGLDVRTLQRQLAAADTSFGQIVQEARMTLIPRHLDQSDRPLAEVAGLLGFSAASAFARWHRTHYGVSPSARRRKARRGAGT